MLPLYLLSLSPYIVPRAKNIDRYYMPVCYDYPNTSQSMELYYQRDIPLILPGSLCPYNVPRAKNIDRYYMPVCYDYPNTSQSMELYYQEGRVHTHQYSLRSNMCGLARCMSYTTIVPQHPNISSVPIPYGNYPDTIFRCRGRHDRYSQTYRMSFQIHVDTRQRHKGSISFPSYY
jgi:hypothetical protein